MPARSSCHRSSGPDTPAGKRQPMPTIATGSSRSSGAAWRTGGPAVSGAPVSSAWRWVASAVGFGWSKTRVVGSRRPVAAARELRSSTAVRESKPSSRNALPGSTASADAWPRTAAARPRTRSRSRRVPSAGVRAASCAVRAPAAVSSAGAGAPPGVARARRTSSMSRTREIRPVASRAGARTDQSTSATAVQGAPVVTERAMTATAVSGSMAGMPPRSMRRATRGSVARPPPPQAPQAMETAGSPRPRRCWARASSTALAEA